MAARLPSRPPGAVRRRPWPWLQDMDVAAALVVYDACSDVGGGGGHRERERGEEQKEEEQEKGSQGTH